MSEEMPARVAARPVCKKRKLPIPFSVEILPDGSGDFTHVDPERIAMCLRLRLCGVCGQYITYWVAFIGGPYSASENGAYTDPGMHEECAEWAMKLCPFIARRKVPRREQEQEPITDPRVVTVDNQKGDDGWVMVVARSFQVIPSRNRDGSVTQLIHPKGVGRRREFTYQGRGLVETNG
jgi:hypothetical protein